ncbi:unnamed protein product, partial [marine sediment metagenome]
LPYQENASFYNSLTIKAQTPLDTWNDFEVKLEGRLVPAPLYDGCDQEWVKEQGHIRFDREGQYTLEATVEATYVHYKSYSDKKWRKGGEIRPLPPGTYDVEAYLTRDHTTLSPKVGRLTYGSSEHPLYWDWKAIVGTMEVGHAPGLGTLFGTVEAKDDSGIASHIEFLLSGPLPATTLMDGFVIYDSEGEYKTIPLPIGDYTVDIEVFGWFFPYEGAWTPYRGYRYKTFEVSIGQGWNEKNMVFEPPYD